MIRLIDTEKCTGCGTCFKSCSLDVFRLDTHQPECSPCMKACPAGSDIRGFNHLIQQNKLKEALSLLKKTMPFPAITGRVCFHPCESQCSRTKIDSAVNINALEQFLGDFDLDSIPEKPSIRRLGRAAVVGSGPAGLSAAWFMALEGWHVTVFEALPRPGGMLRYGIPAYRLPDSVVDSQVAQLEALGVEFRCGIRIGNGADLSLVDLADEGFRAVLLAPGLSAGKKIPVEGIDLPGVYTGVEFLRSLRMGDEPELGRRVCVIGGGNVAIDAAISARLLGAEEVVMCCLEKREQMPAFEHNVQDALDHGIMLRTSLGPVRIEGKEGKACVVEFHRCDALFDKEGRFAPELNRDFVERIEADSIIFAIGQQGDFEDIASGLERNGALIAVSGSSMRTSLPDVFAAGDAVTGPSSVVQAVAAGRDAGRAMCRALSGLLVEDREEAPKPGLQNEMILNDLPRLPRNERRRNSAARLFEEALISFDQHEAQAESIRCLTCGSKAFIAYGDDCMTCYSCELRCPANAIDVHPYKERLPYTLYDGEGGRV